MCVVDPVPTFTYLVKQLVERDLVYLHVVEDGVDGDLESKVKRGEVRQDILFLFLYSWLLALST
jgi:hypothetical protein